MVRRRRNDEGLRFSFRNGDLKFFLPWPIWTTIASAAGMAIIATPDMRGWFKPLVAAPLWDFTRDWVILLVLVLAALATLPQAVHQGQTHLRQRQRDLKKNTELKTAAISFSARTANLITKVDDVLSGERDKRYLSHTLSECANYFRARAMQISTLEADQEMHVMLFRLIRSANGALKFERIRQTHTTAGDFDVSISSHKNSDAAIVFNQVVENRRHFFASNEEDVAAFERVLKLREPRYKEYMIVPMFRDGKTVGSDGVEGALMLMSEAQRSIRESDAEVLQTYAWFCSAAQAADKIRSAENAIESQEAEVA